MKKRIGRDWAAFNAIGHVYLTLFTLICVIPFIMIISGSLTESSHITRHGYSILPGRLSTAAYRTFFNSPEAILYGYRVTLIVTAAGTLCGLILTSMTSYVLYRRDFKYRNKFAFYLYFTTLFSGGLVPLYIIMTKYLQLKNTYLALILPNMMSVFYILIMRNFMSASIHDSLVESAKIDGASDFYVYRMIIMPLLKPALACIGLFMGVQYWNDWSSSMLYITREYMFSLQYRLYRILTAADALREMMGAVPDEMLKDMPTETTKLAMTVVSVGPIVLAYPFVQKYFVGGIMVGAVKG